MTNEKKLAELMRIIAEGPKAATKRLGYDPWDNGMRPRYPRFISEKLFTEKLVVLVPEGCVEVVDERPEGT